MNRNKNVEGAEFCLFDTCWLAYAVGSAAGRGQRCARPAVETVVVLATARLHAYPVTLHALLVSLRLDDHVHYPDVTPPGG